MIPRILATIAGVCLLAAPLARAQSAPGTTPPPSNTQTNGGHGQHELEPGHFARELGLSQQQIAQLRALHQQEHQAIETIRGNTSLTPQQKHEQVHAARESFRQQRWALLTPAQQTQFKAIVDARIEGQNPPPPPGEYPLGRQTAFQGRWRRR